MKLFTLIENQHRLEKAEVEIELIPGIPQIHFLGLPDKAIKESFFRIKSSLRSSGYKFPISKQVIVNIKPQHLKKSSKGVELAVALGILVLTGQKELSDDVLSSIIYGQLDLSGKVNQPQDLKNFITQFSHEKILSGIHPRHKTHYEISMLGEEVSYNENIHTKREFKRPQSGLSYCYSCDEAEIIFLSVITGCHVILAGASGAGKSTLIKNLHSFMSEPKDQNYFNDGQDWISITQPHYSVTPAAFLGGGQNLFQGEIEKAQNGLLILDELLEFNPQILEALRGPMTGEKLRLARGGSVREFDCKFQVLATTNLCPCGQWTPQTQTINCRFSKKRCSGYLDKLSGPILDRFGLMMYYNKKQVQRKISGESILKRIQKFEAMKNKNPNRLNTQMELVSKLYSNISNRKLQTLLLVAEIYATERESSKIENIDLNKAEKWTLTPFLELEHGMS